MPINTLASALFAACFRDLPDIEVTQADPSSERAYLDKASPEQRSEYFALLKSLATPDDRADFYVSRNIATSTARYRPRSEDCEVTMFPQTWGSTALGYGGIGGQAVTVAYTVIVRCKYTSFAAVYFGQGGRLAYLVSPEKQGDAWEDAVKGRQMPSCRDAEDLFGWVAP